MSVDSYVYINRRKHPACRPCTDASVGLHWMCTIWIHLIPLGTGQGFSLRSIASQMLWVDSCEVTIGSRRPVSIWDRMKDRDHDGIRRFRDGCDMSDHSGSRELCICRQVICDALQVQRKHHGEDRVWRTVSRRQPELPQHVHDLLLIADRLGVFCVESIVFSDSSTPLCEAPKLNLKLMSEMCRNVSKCEN